MPERDPPMRAREKPIICIVTRARGAAGSPERTALVSRLAAAADAGATMIQVRERHLDDRALLAFVRELLDATRSTSCAVLVNDRLDIVLATGAHGVHLKSDGVSVQDVRRIAPAGLIVGRSVHSETEAIATGVEGGCDYLFFGTVFPSASKPTDHPVAGTDRLRRVCDSVALPVVAIGGVTTGRAAEVARAGAAGIAAVSLFVEAPDIAHVVTSLHHALTVNQGRV